MRKLAFFTSMCVLCGTSALAIPPVTSALEDLESEIQNAKVSCSDLSKDLSSLKRNATIAAVLSGTATVGSAVAVGAGVAQKNNRTNGEEEIVIEGDPTEFPVIVNCDDDLLTSYSERWIYESFTDENDEQKCKITGKSAWYDTVAESYNLELREKRNNQLYNVKTAGMAVGGIGNVGAITANIVGGKAGLNSAGCTASIHELSKAYVAATGMGGCATKMGCVKAKKIIDACRDYEYLDWKKINNPRTWAMIGSAVGVTTSMAGIVVEGTNNNPEKAEKREKTANALVGTSAVAGAAATALNAVYISELKKAIKVAENCEEALEE